LTPRFDYHALAPEIVLAATIIVVLVADFFFKGRQRFQTSRVATIGVLASLVPVLTLALDGADRSMFGGAYVVDNYALALKAFFLLVAYLTLLVSVDYIGEGDYYQGEYYFLILSSVLGMVVMASARDLITIFVALELISVPTYVLAGWRKHDTKSNEAAIKYYLIGVLSSAVMLYGMSLIFGMAGSTLLSDIGEYATGADLPALFAVAIFLTLVGFAFKISAVPFHFWAPDTYEGSPTPVTAFLSVASKAGGFVAILSLVYFGFFASETAWQPILWALSAASMTLGNLTALRQTNIVRMLAYSSIAQGGFILAPLAVAAEGSAESSAFEAVVVYLLIYGAMNIGAFAVVIAVARRTRSAEIESYSGLGQTAPALAVLMTIFLFSLAGIPPLAGWFAKFVMFRAVFAAGSPAAYTLGVIAAVNSVIALFYYAGVARRMWFHEPAEATVDAPRTATPPALGIALAITTAVVVVIGVYPQLFARVGELAFPG
jgi:NADH-quinone oxidoreductase subunit N